MTWELISAKIFWGLIVTMVTMVAWFLKKTSDNQDKTAERLENMAVEQAKSESALMTLKERVTDNTNDIKQNEHRLDEQGKEITRIKAVHNAMECTTAKL